MLKDYFEGRKRALAFSTTVPAGETEEETFELTNDATIEDLRVRFYPGQELSLQIQVYLLKKDQDKKIDLVEYPGDKKHLSGNDDYFEFDLSKKAKKGDKIVIKSENTDSQYAYDYKANMSVEEAGGLKRVI
jgi:hypothetical protein